MKVLYAIQGTGNGHLSRARAVIPVLLSREIELDILVSGIQADIAIPYPIKYNFKGLSFIFGKKGGVNMWNTYLKSNTSRLKKEINNLPIENYDLVINDFEPVSAWACKLKKIPCVSFSHQAAVILDSAPKPIKNDIVGKLILENYAPSQKQFGLHFSAYEESVFTPIIRPIIRNAKPEKKKHYTVYLPSYSDEKIIKVLGRIKQVQWQVFSKHCLQRKKYDNVDIQPINNDAFISSMINCTGVLCGAGFETPAEALYLNKKLMVIPMKGQYEQQCNAAALKKMGVPTLKVLKDKFLAKIIDWINDEKIIQVNFPDQTDQIIDQILDWAIVNKATKW